VATSALDFATLKTLATDSWLEYKSPNYDFSFNYPSDWKIQVHYDDVYAGRDASGVISGERVSGPVTESIKLFNQTAASSHVVEGAFPTQSVLLDIVLAPDVGGEGCLPADSGNPRRIDLQIGGAPTTGTISIVEPPLSDPVLYFVSAITPVAQSHLAIAGYSYGDPSGVEAIKTVMSTFKTIQWRGWHHRRCSCSRCSS